MKKPVFLKPPVAGIILGAPAPSTAYRQVKRLFAGKLVRIGSRGYRVRVTDMEELIGRPLTDDEIKMANGEQENPSILEIS